MPDTDTLTAEQPNPYDPECDVFIPDHDALAVDHYFL